MDQLILQKSPEIMRMLSAFSWRTPVLDLGEGARRVYRALTQWAADSKPGSVQKSKTQWGVTLFELPEVAEAARDLYPEQSDWEGIIILPGDFRTYFGAV